MNYFVIYNGDGDTRVTKHTEADLKAKLAEGYWGEKGFLNKSFESDTNYWGDNILIIKGDVVVPQAVQTVTEYKI